MNLYGLAAGHPVNFSDPFGLCPPIQSCLALAGAAASVDGPLPVGDVAALGFLGTAARLALKASTGDIALPHAKDAERRREQAAFHRRAGSEEIALVQASGELWGRAPRNMTQSTTPAAKAYSGTLPAGARGYELIHCGSKQRFPWLVSPSGSSRLVSRESGCQRCRR